MKWESFEGMFHESWHSKMKPFIESEACDKIYQFLKKESGRGKKIAPLSSDVFRCFKETSLDNLKIVIMGLSPYHTFRNGIPVTNGLLMDCSVTGRLQPSLEQFYGAIEHELYKGLNVNLIKDPDLTYLANQGVLLCNASLTVEMNKPASHMKIWHSFIKYLFEDVLDTTRPPVVFLGKEAAKYKGYVAPFSWIFELTHPASASYSNTEWDSQGVFKKLNKILMDTNGEQIKWMKNDS